MAQAEERYINRAVELERSLMASLYSGTAEAGGGQVRQSRTVTNDLLGRNDPQLRDRLSAYGDFLSNDEKDAIDRRSTRAGGASVYGTESGGAQTP